VVVQRLFVAGLSGAAPAGRLDLRMHEVEGQQLGVDRRGFAQPRTFAVDLQPERAQESRLAEIESRERTIGAALTAQADDQQRGAAPRIENVGLDECDRHYAPPRLVFIWSTPP
jgi:hypothetical protein